jgi:hypothetical protein
VTPPPPLRRRREDQPVSLISPEAAETSDSFDNGHSSGEDNSWAYPCGSVEGNNGISETVDQGGRDSQSPPLPFCSGPAAALPSPPPNATGHENETFETQEPSPLSDSFMRDISHGTTKPILTFQDSDRRTAHSIGLAGEQDTNLLASLRSIVVNEHNVVDAGVIQVFPGDLTCGDPPVHFNIVTDDLPQQDKVTISIASDAIEELVGSHGPRLVSFYFNHVHPVNCVVSKGRFLRAYQTNKLSIRASLRGVIYGLGAMFWNRDPDSSGPLLLDLHALFQQAHYALHTENHAPNIWTLQACMLLLHERPGDNFTIETPRTWILSAQAVASAQMLGLHRDPKLWNIAPWEKHVRRKLWWATYMSDVWTSVCHGNPPHISNDSFTTSPMGIEELIMEDDVEEDLQDLGDRTSVSDNIASSARFVEAVKLSRILHELLDSF